MSVEEMIGWLEESKAQGDDLGHNTKPITQVIAKLRAAEELSNAVNDKLNDYPELYAAWNAFERAGEGNG